MHALHHGVDAGVALGLQHGVDVAGGLGPDLGDEVAPAPAVGLVPHGDVAVDQFGDSAHADLLLLAAGRVACRCCAGMISRTQPPVDYVTGNIRPRVGGRRVREGTALVGPVGAILRGSRQGLDQPPARQLPCLSAALVEQPLWRRVLSRSLPAVASKASSILDIPVGAPRDVSPAVAAKAGAVPRIAIAAPGVSPAVGPAVAAIAGPIAGIAVAAPGVRRTAASIARPIVGIGIAAALCLSRCDCGRCARSRNAQTCQEQPAACNASRRDVSLSKRQRLVILRNGLRIISHLTAPCSRAMVVLQTNLVSARQPRPRTRYLQGNGGGAAVALSSPP
jgi:hypothetical protein